MVGGQLTLSLVCNDINSGSDLKEVIRLAILHLQKTETENAAKTITTLLGFAQAITDADNWKKARDAASGQKYVPPSEDSIQKLFSIIADGKTPSAAQKLCASVPQPKPFTTTGQW